MYLDKIYKAQPNIEKLAKESCTYSAYYAYWMDQLFERIMRLFVWEGMDSVLPKEIETRMILQGYCSILKLRKDKELTAPFSNLFGITKYPDEFTQINYNTPIESGQRTIGKNCVVISNNSLRNPTYALLHHYATLLAHAEVTFVDSLINLRDVNIPIVQTELQKRSVLEYQAKRFHGKYGAISDPAMLGLEYVDVGKNNRAEITDIWVARQNILKSFYSDIGIRSAYEKRSNTVAEEVEADTGLLLLNLSDMLKKRQEGCEAVNTMFGVNWSVHIAEEIDYGEENEVVEEAEAAEAAEEAEA